MYVMRKTHDEARESIRRYQFDFIYNNNVAHLPPPLLVLYV